MNHGVTFANETGDMSSTIVGLPTNEALDGLLTSLRSGSFEISTHGSPVILAKELGRGGSKTVYDATIEGATMALGLPNTTDGIERMREKWTVVMHEPAATDRIRGLGLLVNPLCRLQEVEINGTPFPAIVMHRYHDLPYQVKDGKNSSSSVSRGAFQPGSLSEQWFTDKALQPLAEDCATLIAAGANLHRDSFSTCVTMDGELRLFLHDLGNATFEQTGEHSVDTYARGYARFVIGSFTNAVNEPEYRGNKAFFDELSAGTLEHTGLYRVLVDRVTQLATQSRPSSHNVV